MRPGRVKRVVHEVARGAEGVREGKALCYSPQQCTVMQGPSSQTIVKLVHNGLQFIGLLLFLLRNNATYRVCCMSKYLVFIGKY